MSKLNSLRDLYVAELKDIYFAENLLTKSLPKMQSKATNPKLKQAFETHLVQTQGQIKRLDQIFEMLGETEKSKPCKAMQGIVAEGEEMMSEDATPEVMDAALISSAQRAEHYEIAGYGCLRTYAEELGEKEQSQLLQATLIEERETDELLTHLAKSRLNLAAV
ncbi:MAG: ferritin-like domain-containing protein [Chthonomonadaceae bacterium]|nr:ferritin-like domain-containing protein [Chthonomonadaceae bacterium]